MSKGRVVLAMSGGVDSSVSAQLLVEQGYDVVGLFMRTGAHSEADACETSTPSKKIRGCCSAIDAADAQRIADGLNISFYALNFSEEFTQIQDYFVDEYLRGRTPNPCVVCNNWLKFGKLWEYAQAIDADYIATGHYARVMRDGEDVSLHAAVDPSKDQSYFLFGIRREILRHILFPIGGLEKSKVREIAESAGLAVSNKPDSQEICFVPSGNYMDFVHKHRPDAQEEPGEIVDVDGNRLAEHAGISRFTIGQRKGLGVAVGEPRHVLSIDRDSRRVVIGPKELLQRRELHAERMNWLMDPPTTPTRCEVKIRYLHHPKPATATPLEENRVRIEFDEPQSAVTPGQAVVLYEGSQVLGGGWICDNS